CICRKGFAGPRCQRTSSVTLTLTLSDSDEITQSSTRNRKLSETLSNSATLDPASATHTVSPSYSPTKSPSMDRMSATMSATDTFTSSRQRNSSTAAVSYSHSQSEDITSSRTCSSSLSLTRSKTEDVTYSRTYSSSNSVTGSQSSTQSATETAPPSETSSLSWSITHTANTSITLSVTTSLSISKTSTLSTTTSNTFSLSPTLSRTPSSTTTISISTSASRRSFTFEASSSESASTSMSASPTTTSSHTPTLTVASARITSSLSCTTASRVSIRTDYEDLIVNATSSPPKKLSASVPRCSPLLKTLAEAALSNKTIVPCVPLYGGVSGTMLTSPGSRGPDPPFILAIAFELDANWQVRLTTNSSALLVADDTKNSTLLDNATLLTTTSGTLFILIEATPAWMSRTSVPIEAVCGFHSYMTEFVVAWPQKQLGIADQVIVGLVSGGGVLTGNPTAAAALAMVGMLSCSGSTPAAQSAGFFVSLFFSVGPAAVGLGNLGLIFAILALHYCIVRVWMWYKAVDEDVATSDMRFPAVGVFLAMFLLPGAVYGGVVCVSSGEDVGIGVVVLILVLALAISSQVYLVKYVLPISEFEPYPCPHPTALAVEKLALLPSARWMPESSERRFTPLMGTRTKDWSTLSIADLLLALCLSSATGLGVGSNGASCSVMPIIVAVVYLGNAAVIIILRPHRRPMDRATFPLIWSLLGTLCLLKYLVVAEVLSDGMQLGLSTLQLWQTVCAVWVFFRERQWQATVSQSTSGRLFDDVVKKSTDDHNDVDDEDIFFDLNIEEDVDNDDHIAEEGGSLEDARTSNDSFSSPSSAHQSFVGGEFDLLHNYNNAESSSSSFGGGLNLLLRRTTSSITSTFSRATASFRRHSISINKKNSNNDTLREFYDLIGEGSSFSNQHNKGNNEGGGNDELIITASSVENPILKALLAAEAPDAAVTSLHTSGGGPSRRHRSESTASNRSRYTQHVVDNLNEAGDTSNNEQQQIHLFDDNVAAIDEQERRRAQHPALIVEQQRLRSGSHVSFVQGGTNHRTEQF
ncbi:transmembrane protein, putative, partial [Bodo saltans]